MTQRERDHENELMEQAMNEYYEELHADFLAGMIQVTQAWESLEMKLNVKFREESL